MAKKLLVEMQATWASEQGVVAAGERAMVEPSVAKQLIESRQALAVESVKVAEAKAASGAKSKAKAKDKK